MQRDLKISLHTASLLEARIGGPSIFSEPLMVPIGRDNKPMSLLLSLPLDIVAPKIFCEKNFYCSVFFSCDLSDSLKHLDEMADCAKDKTAGSAVFIHKPGPVQYEFEAFPSRKLEVSINEADEPSWVQSEIAWAGHNYVCEIYFGSDFNRAYPNLRGLFRGSVGYLFLKNEVAENENCGALLLQDS